MPLYLQLPCPQPILLQSAFLLLNLTINLIGGPFFVLKKITFLQGQNKTAFQIISKQLLYNFCVYCQLTG